MKSLLSVLFVMVIAMPLYPQMPHSFRTDGRPAPSAGQPAETIELTSKVIKQQYCLQYLDEQTQYAKLRLDLQLESKNVSNRTLIIPRYKGGVVRTVLAKNADALKKSHYVYESRATLRAALKPLDAGHSEFLKAEPPAWLFKILSPNASHSYTPDQLITIDLEDLGDDKRRLQDGDYVLQINIQTWSWDYETAKQLRLRWAKHGDLWYENLMSEPLAVSIRKPDNIATRCK